MGRGGEEERREKFSLLPNTPLTALSPSPNRCRRQHAMIRVNVFSQVTCRLRRGTSSKKGALPNSTRRWKELRVTYLFYAQPHHSKPFCHGSHCLFCTFEGCVAESSFFFLQDKLTSFQCLCHNDQEPLTWCFHIIRISNAPAPSVFMTPTFILNHSLHCTFLCSCRACNLPLQL